ncbi:hypothetical protein [Streptomyces benahoarensis]|uniref:Uncharacterized protein n=1 Tax=Streptomyces benahoarensis TaxID=2595054 RepID=A0A553ZRM5_9ACTN|nr:hypothetical protein [Streptomyces benahoarensis]TSB32382.1 hypothetical protein FNJ62_01850 [Streptomyces benahoarensis]TSB44005.1 hypothetical protein FNZ23_01540 [Streptomyces benahoarensis]
MRKRLTKARRHAAEAQRRRKVAARRLIGTAGKTARFSYLSASKEEVTVREITLRSAELRTSKKGNPYIRAFDLLRGERRSFSPSRIGWTAAAEAAKAVAA